MSVTENLSTSVDAGPGGRDRLQHVVELGVVVPNLMDELAGGKRKINWLRLTFANNCPLRAMCADETSLFKFSVGPSYCPDSDAQISSKLAHGRKAAPTLKSSRCYLHGEGRSDLLVRRRRIVGIDVDHDT